MKNYMFFLTMTKKIYDLIERHRIIADNEFKTEEQATLTAIQQEIVALDEAEARRIIEAFEKKQGEIENDK